MLETLILIALAWTALSVLCSLPLLAFGRADARRERLQQARRSAHARVGGTVRRASAREKAGPHAA
jgi:hypothetical protein